jgi:hypothetical protein
MARNALLILFSLTLWAALPAFAQDSEPDAWRKPDQLVRALALKQSDVVAVLEPSPFVVPRIADRVRMVISFNDPAAAHGVDVIVLNDALHTIEHRDKLYPKLHQLLRLGGRVVNVDLSAELPAPQAVREFTAAGFHITKTVAFLPVQYFQVFE